MKKLKILFLIVISFLFVGCGTTPTISYANSSITIEKGDYYNINTSNINVVGTSSYTLSYSIDNLSIASITNSTIKAESIGKTTLQIMARFVLNQVETTVEIVVIPKIVRADSVSVTNKNINLNLQNEYTFNKLTATNSKSQTVNEVPNIVITPKIVEYDYISGKVTGLSTGECVVTINYTKCSVSFNVNVYNHIYVKTFVLTDTAFSNTITMFNGESGKLNYSFTPANANTFEFSTESDLLNITKDGVFETLGEGTAKVTLKYNKTKNETITQEFYIEIVKKLSVLEVEILSNPDLDEHLPLLNTTINKNIAIKEKEYLLKICVDTPIDISKVTISNNITLLSSWEYINNTYYSTITFNNLGDDTISLEYKNTLYNVKNEVKSNDYNVRIYSLENLVIEVRHNLLAIGKNGDTFTIYKKPDFLESFTSHMTYVDFVCYLDEEKLLPYTDGVSSSVSGVTLVGNIFNAISFEQSSTPYEVKVQVMNIEVDSFFVKVLEPNISINVDYVENTEFSENKNISVDLSIVNNFDETIYSIDYTLTDIRYNSSLDNYISSNNNIITLKSYISEIELDIYYNETYIKTIKIYITN
ncbi:MAG: hypothetical protein IJW28_00965 [Clostridia bacterium]|nr:hypothetical protein [Clostridia bacterium]